MTKKQETDYNLKDLADSMFVPEKLTAKQAKQARNDLTVHRENRRAKISENERLQLDLMKLKIQIEDYTSANVFKPEFSFRYFLEKYLTLINKKKKDFAKDIQVHETYLS